MNKLMWWGYLHKNNTIQVKRWFGDHKDYTTDCIGNPFVQKVVPPFEANHKVEATDIITQQLKPVDEQMQHFENYLKQEDSGHRPS